MSLMSMDSDPTWTCERTYTVGERDGVSLNTLGMYVKVIVSEPVG